MPTSSIKVFLVTLLMLASVSQTAGTCNLLAAKFRLFGCALQRGIGCGLIDAKLRLLGCRQFGCEGYRDYGTFCTLRCRDLEISNGICRFGTKCCLNQDISFGSSSSGSFSFDLDGLTQDTVVPEAN